MNSLVHFDPDPRAALASATQSTVDDDTTIASSHYGTVLRVTGARTITFPTTAGSGVPAEGALGEVYAVDDTVDFDVEAGGTLVNDGTLTAGHTLAYRYDTTDTWVLLGEQV